MGVESVRSKRRPGLPRSPGGGRRWSPWTTDRSRRGGGGGEGGGREGDQGGKRSRERTEERGEGDGGSPIELIEGSGGRRPPRGERSAGGPERKSDATIEIEVARAR